MDMNFQTVFDDAVEVQNTFDVMFGGEEDDALIGIVLGEADQNPDFNTLDDGETTKELKDDLEGDEFEKPTIDSNGSFEIDNFDKPGDDIACSKYGVADAVEKSAPDEEDIESEIDKSENKSDINDLEESAANFLDRLYESDEADLGVDPDELNDDEQSDEFEDNSNAVNDPDMEVGECGDYECPCGECPNPPVVYDEPVEEELPGDEFEGPKDDDEPIMHADDLSDDGTETPYAPDSEAAGCGSRSSVKKEVGDGETDGGEGAGQDPIPDEEVEESAFDIDDIFREETEGDDEENESNDDEDEDFNDDDDNDDVEVTVNVDKGSDDEDESPKDESAFEFDIDSIFEADAYASEEEKLEDEIIDDVESDEELSDAEAEELAASGDDEDIIDEILGDDD